MRDACICAVGCVHLCTRATLAPLHVCVHLCSWSGLCDQVQCQCPHLQIKTCMDSVVQRIWQMLVQISLLCRNCCISNYADVCGETCASQKLLGSIAAVEMNLISFPSDLHCA